MQEPVGLSLQLPSQAENVAVVRAAISGIAAATELDDELCANLKTAVSEACNNVCLHAYPDGETGPMLVRIECLSRGVRVSVRDHGHGITRISSRSDRMGLGLAVINALSDRAEFRNAPGGGTEVRILFSQPILALSGAPQAPGQPEPDSVSGEEEERDAAWLEGPVRLWCNTAELQRHVLARMLTFIAASAHFSVTSVDDLAAANDAIADHVERGAEGWIGAGITSSPRRLRLSVGPLEPRADPDNRLMAAVESVESEPVNGQCVIRLTITDRQRR
jgi:anti-sigma regulatory factor (Ser/Thr protein kinase)